RRCRVLGKAGVDLGGMTIDQWIYEEVLRRHNRCAEDPDILAHSQELLQQCMRAKESLSFADKADITLVNVRTGAVLVHTTLTREDFERLLDQQEAFTTIDRTIRRALKHAQERGYSDEQIQAVLMVGGSSLIPSVRQTMQRIFGRERVKLDRPLDAVARGAAAFVAGVDFYDHIQHDYAIQYFDPQKGAYEYRVIVKRGTSYPSNGPIARLRVKAHHEDQTQLGIAIYELGEARVHRAQSSAPVALVYGQDGNVHLVQESIQEEERRSKFYLNESAPTFLTADPPARAGEVRFEVWFSIDGNKRLLISARDVKTGRQTHRDYPVVKLT
ncbi:MAG: Hsp70 family protein, partial [Candidatus Hadarchaeum sp.]